MKKLLIALTLCAGSGLVFAQAPAQNPLLNDPTPGDRSIGPGDPGWKGETIQVSAPPAGSTIGSREKTQSMPIGPLFAAPCSLR